MRESTAGPVNPVADQSNWRRKLKAGRIKLDDRAKGRYLDELRKHGKRQLAASAVNITTQTVNIHAKNDPEFAQAIQLALDLLGESRVNKIEVQALDGNDVVKSRVTSNGEEEIHRETRFESGIRGQILKRYDPGYRDALDLKNVSGMMGGVLIIPAVDSLEQWNSLFHPDNPEVLDDDAT